MLHECVPEQVDQFLLCFTCDTSNDYDLMASSAFAGNGRAELENGNQLRRIGHIR
jgi:hypothetical protein